MVEWFVGHDRNDCVSAPRSVRGPGLDAANRGHVRRIRCPIHRDPLAGLARHLSHPLKQRMERRLRLISMISPRNINSWRSSRWCWSCKTFCSRYVPLSFNFLIARSFTHATCNKFFFFFFYLSLITIFLIDLRSDKQFALKIKVWFAEA